LTQKTRTRKRVRAQGKEKVSPKTPLEVLTDRASFEAVTKAFSEIAIRDRLSSRRAFACVRGVLGPQVAGMTINWLRAFMRLLVVKNVLRRVRNEGKSKRFMLEIGDLKYRSTRRMNRACRHISSNGQSFATNRCDSAASAIENEIASLKARLVKLEQARALLS